MSGTENNAVPSKADALLAGLAISATKVQTRRVVKTFADLRGATVAHIVGVWRKKPGVRSADLPDPADVADMITSQVVSLMANRVASLTASLSSATVTADDIQVSASGKFAILTLRITDPFTGDSASVNVRYSGENEGDLGSALAAVAPQRKQG